MPTPLGRQPSSPHELPAKKTSFEEFESLRQWLDEQPQEEAHGQLQQEYVFRYKKKKDEDWQGNPLHLACVQPPSAVVSAVVAKLLALRASVDEHCNVVGGTLFLAPLHLAAGSDNADVISKLIEAGADPDSMSFLQKRQDEHYTPLHEAVSFANVASVKTLLDKKADVNHGVKFRYKKIRNVDWQGLTLHLACVQPPSDAANKVIATLLERHAQVRSYGEVLRTDNRGSTKYTSLTPLHLAAGSDNADAISLLVDAGAAPDSMSLLRDSESNQNSVHFTPLHEAVFFANLKAIDMLLEKNANIDATNKDAQTGLHIAVKARCRGKNAEVVKYLVDNQADLTMQDRWGHTPLIAATMTYFPKNKLHVLSSKTMLDIIAVAEQDPETAAELMKATKAGHQDDAYASWREALTGGTEGCATAAGLLQLLLMSPPAAADVLEALTVTPKAESDFHYAVPLHAQPERFAARRCAYVTENAWRQPQQWHTELCRGAKEFDLINVGDLHQSRGRIEDLLQRFERLAFHSRDHRPHANEKPWQRKNVRVHVKLLLLPDIVDVHMLNGISECDWHNIFSVEAVRALLDHIWTDIGWRHYVVHFVFRMFELLILILLAKWPPATPLWRDISWSFLCTTSMREILMEYEQMKAYHTQLHAFWCYLSWANFWDILSMSMLASVVWQSFGSREIITTNQSSSSEASNALLAAVCFARWVQILYMLRAFQMNGLGLRLVPLVKSFFNVVGISFVCLLLFCAFAHAFSVLEAVYEPATGPSWEHNRRVFLQAFRLLVAGDGDGIDYILHITGNPDGTILTELCVIFGYTIFGIFLLNLFIAVHGQAFDSAEDSAWELFYKERASLCLSAMLQPYFPRADMMDNYVALIILAPLAWIMLLSLQLLHPVFPALLFCAFSRIGDRMLLARNVRRNCMSASTAGSQQDVGSQGSGNEGVGYDAWRWICSRLGRLNELDAPLYSHGLLEEAGAAGSGESEEPPRYLWWCGWESSETLDENSRREETAVMNKLMQLWDRMTTVEQGVMKKFTQMSDGAKATDAAIVSNHTKLSERLAESAASMTDEFMKMSAHLQSTEDAMTSSQRQISDSMLKTEEVMLTKFTQLSEKMMTTEADVKNRLANVESKLDMLLEKMGSPSET